MTIEEKLKVLQNGALKEIEKKHGEGSYYLGKKVMPHVDVLCSTGSIDLDNALTIGGWPKNRLIEISGKESSGKTTMCLISIAEAQKQGHVCAFVDAEQAFDKMFAKKLGVNTDDLIILQPDTAEEGFDQIHSIIKSGVVSLIVVDSTNSLIPKRIFDGEVGDAAMGRAALLFSQEYPKVRTECTQSGCTAIFISQLRKSMSPYESDKIGVGEAGKYYFSIRIKTRKAEVQKDDGEVGQTSVDVILDIFKNKVGVPFKKAQFTLLTGQDGLYGIDSIKEIIEYGIRFNFIKKAGAWFTIGDEKFNGMPQVRNYFKEHEDAFISLKDKVISELSKYGQEIREGSFDSTMEQIIAENEKPSRKRKSKSEDSSIEIKEENVSDGEIVGEESKE